MSDPAPCTTRRTWLFGVLQASIAATAAAIFYPVVRFLWPREATVSGALEVVAPLGPEKLPFIFDFGGKPCLVIRTPDGVRAFNAVCTHLDCTVEFREAQNDIVCNCHNGVYDLTGRNVSGPPPRPLETYKAVVREKEGQKGKEEIVVSRST